MDASVPLLMNHLGGSAHFLLLQCQTSTFAMYTRPTALGLSGTSYCMHVARALLMLRGNDGVLLCSLAHTLRIACGLPEPGVFLVASVLACGSVVAVLALQFT